ncbi:MAG UNVERIFIED_CONTAM: hypothetical protein LVR18_45065 [Planctomycetaceae bacterium]
MLDSNDIPESLRELQPRRLPVQYADIDEMASIVNDAFKPYMEPAGGRGARTIRSLKCSVAVVVAAAIATNLRASR